jgi:hypothetical protein
VEQFAEIRRRVWEHRDNAREKRALFAGVRRLEGSYCDE